MTLILAATVAGNLWVMRIASADPSFAIEPDYYRKAVNWDSTMAQERVNQALGWRLIPTLRGFGSSDGADLHVTVVDAQRRPIAGATVRVSAFAVARSNDVVNALLAPDDAGYRARLRIAHGGAWELRFDVRRGTDHMVVTRRVEAVAGEGVARGGPPLPARGS
jgi:nitrogen fixation protein FixH